MAKDANAPARPLPRLTELDTAAFWAGTKAGEFRYQQCANCDTVIWHPRAHCTGCVQGDLQWRVAAGQGTIYSFSIVRQSYHPFFRGLVPYVVALVDLDEGLRFLTNVVGLDNPEDVRIGMRVSLQWEAHDEVSVPLVAPI